VDDNHLYVYEVDESGDAEALPTCIAPNTNAGNKRHKLIADSHAQNTDTGTSNNFTVADGKYVVTDKVRARDADGLKLEDDGGNGMLIKDGGKVIAGNGFCFLDENHSIYAVTGEGVYIDTYSVDPPVFIQQITGNVDIGGLPPNQKLTVEGTMSLKEQTAANASTAAYGQIWVKNTTPNELFFTDDAGTDTQISSHPLDAPPELYTHGPGIDWIGKRVQPFLGVIFWQTLNGTVTEETFDAYNARRKDAKGHQDLVKQDWDAVQIARLREEKLKEIVEEEVTEAFDDVEIMEEIEAGSKTDGYRYSFDDAGNCKVEENIVPVKTKQGTGKFEKQLKAGVSFDAETGKFIRKRNMTEAEVDALELQAPAMPEWMQAWRNKETR
jgi:hypothetical protein